MKNEFPLYPELPEAGKQEAQELVNKFKKELLKASKDVLDDLYCEVVCHIESDSWTNYRNSIMNGFKDYNNRKLQASYDFKEIRQKIYEEYRDDIISDLNQDLVEENKGLKEDIERLRKSYNRMMERRYISEEVGEENIT